MMIAEACQLVEADSHVVRAHQCVRHQRRIVARLRATGRAADAGRTLLARMAMTVPIVEDLRQQLLGLLSGDR